ncbi:MAG: 23S rRNA (guanosine(2251)-2'-O)-methyltransferase RlmB [Clostridia bacterium]|nr:23S rRNA (guanosine(2251)-2'-O)-methyltransferase RlmB [Clostridia bacterium]
MTRADHLRSEGKWEEEGTRYRKSTAQQDKQRRENGKDGFDLKRGGKPGNRFDAPKGRDFKKDRSFDGPRKNDFKKPGPRPERPERFDRPALKPAPKPEYRTEPEERLLPPENLLSGRNPIREAIKSGRDIEKLLVAKGDLSGTAKEIIAMAKERHIPVQMVERSRLDEITPHHQGMLAYASAYRYYDVEDMLAEAKEKGEEPFLVVLDGVTDPMNLGAIIRTAACVGAHGVIVPERRAVGLTPSAVKASAGAIETVKVARVTNLTRTLEMLKKQSIWLYAADMDGEDYRKVNFAGPMALIIGAEGEGVSRLVLEASDYRVSLPMRGGVGSLNASVAAGILMYAAMNGRA